MKLLENLIWFHLAILCKDTYPISSINTPGYYYFHTLNPNVLYLNNAIVWYYSKVHCYFYAYKQLYVISFLFFDDIAIVSRMTLFTTSDNVIR